LQSGKAVDEREYSVNPLQGFLKTSFKRTVSSLTLALTIKIYKKNFFCSIRRQCNPEALKKMLQIVLKKLIEGNRNNSDILFLGTLHSECLISEAI